ncbi:GMC family oxidoreductase [Pseudooceanicola sp. HF7]|uniref:GMC family oxidoreductase n=1 Tax=Pseudooceanicola sp. HF7 TaxID=2721560 RepID=UPI00142FB098|nr:choline dehydrogenase [Pseudooceanicola sp. HF7]NIZ10617.1 choline dehydrogenase [Pseudooceanicola sp. HF7]
MTTPSEWIETDYLVIGAGSAGCVMTARLSEDAQSKVTVLEAGPRDSNPWIHVPIGYGKTMVDPRINWKFETDPDPSIAGRKMFWPRGKVLGGSSSINGLLYVRGQSADYNHWAQLGNTGWSYDDVLPYFRKAEDQENGPDDFHGEGGPLRVSNLVERNPLCEAFIQSGVAAGIPRNDDFNGARQEGIGYYQLTTRNARRCSAAVGYLRPAAKRPNVRVETDAAVHRILFEGKRATGAVFKRNGTFIGVRASREVILSAGSIKSPHLLLLSGIGPAEQLQQYGVPVVQDSAGVGENLQDHYGAFLSYRSRLPLTINDIMMSPLRQVKAGLQYALMRKGPLTISAAQVGAFVKSHPDLDAPDIQFLFQTFSHGDFEEGLDKFSGFANVVHPSRPESRGTLQLKSADPEDVPSVQANYLSADYDCRVIVDGFRLARDVARQDAMTDHILAEIAPSADLQSDDELLDYARQTGLSIAHQVGTCKMGVDPMAVVDPTLRVRGVEGLRVVDASVMPKLVSGNTNAPTIMIAEKAADLIKSGA